MSELLKEIHNRLCLISLNRIDKHNAFDDNLLINLQNLLDDAIADPKIAVILLKANGKHFSAGADLDWMRRMANFSQNENISDAMVLARVMQTLYSSPKPTVAVIQGAAYGGGAGLVAACDIAIASTNARFCFSEVKLGLIPAVISPYVIKAIGERATKALFMSAEIFTAERAKELGLVHHCVDEQQLVDFSLGYAQQITELAPVAVRESKALVHQVSGQDISEKLMLYTAECIAKKRVSPEGQKGLTAFLNKETVNWNE